MNVVLRLPRLRKIEIIIFKNLTGYIIFYNITFPLRDKGRNFSENWRWRGSGTGPKRYVSLRFSVFHCGRVSDDDVLILIDIKCTAA